jgi:GNAT superfamily N-acetyltransferase
MNQQEVADGIIRRCGPADTATVQAVINAAAEAYRDVIPADRWHEPYMTSGELASELADGVVFSAFVVRSQIAGVMGVQRRGNVDLIRHAYVEPEWQGLGVGSRLLKHLSGGAQRPMLVGTWAAADWAIRFYERHGFSLVAPGDTALLLRAYWHVPERQVATSVVLMSPLIADLSALIAQSRRYLGSQLG